MKIIFCALVILCVSGTGVAQFTSAYGYTFNNPTSAMTNNLMWNTINERHVYLAGLQKRGWSSDQLNKMSTEQLIEAYVGKKGAAEYRATKAPGYVGTAAKGTAKTTAPATPVETPATKFRPSGKRILLPSIVNELSKDPAQRKVLTQAFTGAMAAYETEAKKLGFDNDVAGAIAYFAVVGFFLQDGEVPHDKGSEALAKSLRVAFDTPEYRKVPDIDKQNFYELMVIMGAFLQASADGADAEMMRQLKEVSADFMQKFLYLDPRKVKLTERGIEAR